MKDPMLDVLFSYDRWANRQLFEECRALSPEQLEQPLGLGHGNIEQTLAHMIGSMIFFADRLHRRPPRPRPDKDQRTRTMDDLYDLFETAGRELYEAIELSLESHSMTDLLNWTDDDTGDIDPLDRVSYAVVYDQMIDHSIHHRAQVMDMLHMLGKDPQSEWHPFEWDEMMRRQ